MRPGFGGREGLEVLRMLMDLLPWKDREEHVEHDGSGGRGAMALPGPEYLDQQMAPPSGMDQFMAVLRDPALSGSSRGAAALMQGQNPLGAFLDESGRYPMLDEALQDRGWHPAAALAADMFVPDPFGGADVGLGLLGAGLAAPRLLRKGATTPPPAGFVDNLDLDNLIDLARTEGGFTVDPRTGARASGPGFSVGTNLGDTVSVPLSEATPEMLRPLLREKAGDFAPEGSYMGGWVDDAGNLVIDPVRVEGIEDASQTAIRNQQRAIFDLETGEVISVAPSQNSLSPALRDFESSRETPVFKRKVEGKQVMARVKRVEGTLDAMFKDPAVAARLQGVLAQGRNAAPGDWYDITDMRTAFTEALGSPERAEDLIRIVSIMSAVTSPQTPVTTNVRRAMELAQEAYSGSTFSDLEGILRQNPDALGPIFGQSFSGTMRQKASIQQAFETGEINGQKISTFLSNFLGNSQGVTVDTHNVAGLLMVGGMDYRTPAGRVDIAGLMEFGDPTKLKAMRDAGVTSWADAPEKLFRDHLYGKISQGAEYGAFEAVQQRLAQSMGMTPREFQAALWVGMGKETGVRNAAPFATLFMQGVNKGAQRLGMTPDELIRGIATGTLGIAAVFTAAEWTDLLSSAGSQAEGEEGSISSPEDMMQLLDLLPGSRGG